MCSILMQISKFRRRNYAGIVTENEVERCAKVSADIRNTPTKMNI